MHIIVNSVKTVPYVDLESVDTTGQGDYGLVPKIIVDGDETFVQLRLMQVS